MMALFTRVVVLNGVSLAFQEGYLILKIASNLMWKWNRSVSIIQLSRSGPVMASLLPAIFEAKSGFAAKATLEDKGMDRFSKIIKCEESPGLMRMRNR